LDSKAREELAAQVHERKSEKAVRRTALVMQKKQTRDRVYQRKRLKKIAKQASEHEKELARRILARRELIHFVKRFQPRYFDGWIHHDVCRRLKKFMRAVEAGESPRLMLFMPPRHGKSLLASDYFPSWVLGHHPEFEIIASSYAVSLPLGFSRKVRARVRDKAYQTLFPGTVLDPENSAAEGWMTMVGGGYIAAGVGGGITGKGAHILIIDDPIKDSEEADSETVREKIWDWYGSTAGTRLAPGGGVLVIQTRWHDDDLSGRLIMQMKELREQEIPGEEIDNWEIISYPAIATQDEYLTSDGRIINPEEEPESVKAPGRYLRRKDEALHPDRFPLPALKRKRRGMQPRHWSALYQQNPVPDEGAFFTKDMLRLNIAHPALTHMKLYAAWDLAIGERQTNDYTVGVVGGLDYNDQIHIIDVIRGRMDTFRIAEAILDVYAKYGLEKIGIERGQLELAIRPQLRKRQRERRLYPTYDETLTPISDKEIRARPLQGRMQQGMVYFPQNQPWLETVRHEMLRFPGGVHDDIVDALAWLVRMMMKEAPPTPPKRSRRKSWKDKLNGHLPGKEKHPMAA